MSAKKKAKTKTPSDPLQNLKLLGYSRAFTPPGESTTLSDMTAFAKFFLCKETKTLWKDPVWDNYTDEEILIEYFGHLFKNDEMFKREFEAQLNMGSEVYGDDYDWLIQKVEDNQKEMATQLETQADEIEFTPSGKDTES